MKDTVKTDNQNVIQRIRKQLIEWVGAGIITKLKSGAAFCLSSESWVRRPARRWRNNQKFRLEHIVGSFSQNHIHGTLHLLLVKVN